MSRPWNQQPPLERFGSAGTWGCRGAWPVFGRGAARAAGGGTAAGGDAASCGVVASCEEACAATCAGACEEACAGPCEEACVASAWGSGAWSPGSMAAALRWAGRCCCPLARVWNIRSL